ncbi:uncharacterized protein LY89DRAFT_743968 [Mollisia scopiformis]|uniref:Uncharacterized protein n=1 Tax=Mollisia scopiformis TaxID=149040 RepID=A0A132B3V9_MOLSC|nr:uncharacterized protein LY89DRAFT_743968 [Mollisia scopiformis]KUJ06357.1 hypothetical protein LY89DRAFT_743968 [Mollisia scopiformis]
MATVAFKSYTYVPTAPRFKSAISRRKPASKPISIFDKLQRMKPSSAGLSTPPSATAADDCGNGGLGIRDEYELEVLGSTLDIDPVDKRKRQQEELEQKKDEAQSEDNGLQRDVNDLAAVVTTERVDDTHSSDKGGSPRLAKRQKLLPSYDPLPKLSHNKAKGRNDGNSDDELNNNKTSLEENSKELRSMKRKQLFSLHDSPMQKKPPSTLSQASHPL